MELQTLLEVEGCDERFGRVILVSLTDTSRNRGFHAYRRRKGISGILCNVFATNERLDIW